MSSKLRKLQAQWYKKLAKAGFKDVESLDSKGDMRLKQLDSNQLRHGYRVSTEMESAQRYYELARQFYWEHVFETSREKEVWRLHSEGLSGAAIASELKTLSCSSVKRVVQRLREIMMSQRVGELDD